MIKTQPGWLNDHRPSAMGAVTIRQALNTTGHSALAEERSRLAAELARRYSDRTDIRSQPVMAAYGAFYKRFKKTYHVALQTESVALKGKPIPGPGALVEAMFLAELKNGILTSAHDLDLVSGGLSVDSASGGEAFTGLTGRDIQVKPGDVLLADEQGPIGCIIYGPDKRTAVNPQTSSVVFVAWGVAGLEPELLAAHLRDIAAYASLASVEAVVEGPEIVTA